MTIDVGTRVGPYEVTALLGEGGMGKVWRGRHVALHRDDALKVLPDLFAADPDRLARFEREAQILASLNHPNIARVYGLEPVADARALVMELVDGPTLADRIDDGPIRVLEALAIALQIANALEAAHDRAVIHRDLKPSNIKVRPDGTVKVLDFGLAKAMDGPARPEHQGAATQSPTITTPAVTGHGVILGTAAYMSPEQASGLAVDQRTDIWAFGCVVYEMLTGKRVFPGDSTARVLAKVLERDPDFTALPAATPPRITRLLRRCLEKDPRKRLHSIADARLEIEDVAADHHPPAAEARSRRPGSIAAWATGAFVLGATAAAVGAILILSPPPEAEPIVRSSVGSVPMGAGALDQFGGLAIAPDGRHIAYSARGVLFLRSLADEDARPVRAAERGVYPAFSPDGESLAFFVPTESAIKRVSRDGSRLSSIASTDGGQPAGLSWGADGTIVFATATSGGLWRVRDTGGEPERLTTVEPGRGIFHAWPAVLPNGRGVLFALSRAGSSRISVMSFDTGEVTDIASGSTPRFAPTGHILYEDSGVLRAIGFDPSRFRVTSDSVALSQAVLRGGNARFDISANGSLVSVPIVAPNGTLVWVDRRGGEQPLALPPRNYDTVRLSPDGNRIVADFAEPGRRSEIYVSDVKGAEWTRLPTPDHDGGDWFPWWSSDGSRIVFPIFFETGAPTALFWTAADGTGSLERLLAIPDNFFLDARGWTPDGRSLLFTYGNPNDPRIGLLSMVPENDGLRRWTPLVERVGGAIAGPISPDGNWLVTESAGTTRAMNIYIERFPELGDRRPVSGQGGGINAVWSPKGDELFYVRVSDQAMMAVTVQTSPTLRLGTPEIVFERKDYLNAQPSRRWDVAPDGRFLMIKSAAPPATEASIVLVQHWFDDLRRLVPTR